MKVTLLYPRWTGSYGLMAAFARRNSTWPPLNLALLAAIAEQDGHDVTMVDGEAEALSVEQMVRRVKRINPDAIGLTSFTPFFHLNVRLAEALKEAGVQAPIIVGGPHVRIMGEKAFLTPFDYAFVGEAEKSWPAFLKHLENGTDVRDVKGIWYRKDGVAQTTGEPEPMEDPDGKGFPLDQFPLPARHLLPMGRYKLGTLKGRLGMTSIQTTRGCPWKCIFCASEVLLTTRVIRRSPTSVVSEMKSVVSDFGIRHFYIVDDVMTLNPEHIVEIADRIIAEGLKITFEGSTRANLVEDKVIGRLAEAGLIRLSFGLETVDAEMRKTMKKKVPLKYYEEANRICNKYKVEALNSVMIGLPGETRETVQKTLDWLRSARDVMQANFAIAVPYPGTEFHDMAVSGGNGVTLMTKDFSEYRRYGSAVTTVGDLTPDDLIDLQNDGFVSIYSAPWRWAPMLRKHGIIGGALMLLRVFRMVAGRYFPKKNGTRKVLFSPGDGSITTVSLSKVANKQVGAPNLITLTDSSISFKEPGIAPAGHFGDPKSPNSL